MISYSPTLWMFWYRPIFMVQLLVAELIFAWHLEKRKHFSLRLALGILACIGISFAIPPVYATHNREVWVALVAAFTYLAMFAVTVIVLKCVFNESVKNILFCAVAGYTVQHIAQEFFELFNVIAGVNGKLHSDFYDSGDIAFGQNWFLYTVYAFFYGIMYWWTGMFTVPKIKKRGVLKMKWGSILLFVILLLSTDVIFSSFITYVMPEDTNRLAIIMLHGYNAFCCFLALFLLIDFPRRKKLEEELTVLYQLDSRKAEQYVIAKENINLINMKCHDLKHQIRHLTVNSGDTKEIENLIEIYDAMYKTGNEALDVILTEKSLLCREACIKLSVIAHGEKLRFMKEVDVYSLFGNLLDNATEAVQCLPVEDRSIILSVTEVNEFLFINVYNKYVGKIKFLDGLPITTKKNKDWHGIGIKSIKYIADKYSGEMTIQTKDQIFSVGIIFPVEQLNKI